jgi:nitrous oxide reductase accessory protein NosL
MKRSLMSAIILAVFLAAVTAFAAAADLKPVKPGPRDKCPVCGMFVAKYPDFAAQIRFSDGTTAFFDGTKDLFTYYLELSHYAPGRKRTEVAAIYVNDFYSLGPVNGLSAWYVAGSDVFGPMGKELIAFAREADAREFLKDHKGKSLHRFSEITPALLKGLR